MATLTIRQLDAATHAGLRERAARHGRSVEAEVREILADAVRRRDRNILLAIREAMSGHPDGGVDLDIPPRADSARSADFS